MGREPARDRQEDGVGRQVTGHDPIAVDHRRRQAARDIIPQRTRGDRGARNSMNVGTTTATATSQGLTAGRLTAVGARAALLIRGLLRDGRA